MVESTIRTNSGRQLAQFQFIMPDVPLEVEEQQSDLITARRMDVLSWRPLGWLMFREVA